ncbi:MAG: ribonuclease III [Phycisphaerae bacterium]|nr:ribonuclease III [Phycisphaerae bacterium]
MDSSIRADAEQAIGHTFRDPHLLERALTHASLADRRVTSNERLEFLGDAILGMIVCDHLFETFPEFLEGELTKIKSHVVSRRSCAEAAVSIGLDRLLLLGKGMSRRHALPESVAAAVFESIVAAVYLDAGWEPTRRFVLAHMSPRVEQAARLGHQYNFKSALQQALLQQQKPSAIYAILDEKGPDHAKCFEIAVQCGELRFPARWGTSKKEAEQLAALEALRALGMMRETPEGEPLISWPETDGNSTRQSRDRGAAQSDSKARTERSKSKSDVSSSESASDR